MCKEKHPTTIVLLLAEFSISVVANCSSVTFTGFYHRWNPHISRTFGCIRTAKCLLQTKETISANCCSIQIIKLEDIFI